MRFVVPILFLLQSCAPCVIDIYYPKDSEQEYIDVITQYNKKCYYTLNECSDCITRYIQRKHYKKWAQQYTDLGLEPPHSKRMDQTRLYVNLN